MDYGSRKMAELIEKIERMSVEEFNALYERAEKDFQLFSPSFEQMTDENYQLLGHDISILNPDMQFNPITHVPWNIALGQPRSWFTSSLEPLNCCSSVYAVPLSATADKYDLLVSGPATPYLEVRGEYIYYAYVTGLGGGICTLESSSYEIMPGKTVDHPSKKEEEEEGDAWALAA
jgi:hypothetical protein